ncbi:molybdopterin molybdotransferase MoeA [Kushneria phyllosphaerae]|uniref:Molybdopterin molybdenumtransferase n=1 Tax=Kushneria phyllosphaerae TaxID=2100822 RepID=A0A2R8CQ64_9GAMM|nr:gephyrin-like molybdotransferase Glp [Kushneria phyllosphaerae]SPJ34924.1 Molybdopterin molybdenumtransferase [Kushneria phyllosphaerae]
MSDCFEISDTLLDVDEMLAHIRAATPAPVGLERVALTHAVDRILAEPMVATLPLPRYTASAMDGIAFNGQGRTRFRLVGEALAGHPFDGVVAPGEAVSITTGAPLPVGCDTVVMAEDIVASGEDVELFRPDAVRPGQNIRHAGEEIAIGDHVFKPGTLLGPAQLGMAASLGHEYLEVHCRPRVAIFSSGDELRRAGAADDTTSSLFDANASSLAACLKRWGAEIVMTDILPDRLDASVAQLSSASKQADLIITSGGVSAGQADLIRAATQQLGQITSWRVAMRPGKPMAFGHIQQVPFFGLPGNPVAALITLMQFVQPLFRQLSGWRHWAPVKWYAICEQPLKGRRGRLDLLRGRYHVDAQGVISVSVLKDQGSHRLSSLYDANCLIELPASLAECDTGTPVSIQPLGELI